MCSFCQRSFASVALLREHCRRHVRRVRCPKCSLPMENATDLERHIRTVHDKVRVHECAVCHKRFTQRADLLKHAALHNDALEHTCAECGQQFRWRKQLTEHARIHAEVSTEFFIF